jgi:hypothetical protein
MYELKEMPIAEQSVDVNVANFVTRKEFEGAINRLKNYLIAPAIENTEPSTATAAGKEVPKEERSFDF